MKVLIIGGGAMGCLFGGRLVEGGLDVALVSVQADHVAAINRDGLRMVGHGGERVIRIAAATTFDGFGPADVALVQCKAMDTVAAVTAALPCFAKHTVAISFQNGLGNEEAIAGIVGEDRVLGGLTAQGATVEAPGVVRNWGELPTYVGELFGADAGRVSDRVRRISDAFTAAGLDTRASADIRQDIWKKLLGNIGLSAASGATNLNAVSIAAIPELRAVVMAAIDEAFAVARAEGVDISDTQKHEVFNKQIALNGGTGASKSSLCVDLLNRRPTEVDVIYGVVAEKARGLGLATPTLNALIGIVKGMESHYLADGE